MNKSRTFALLLVLATAVPTFAQAGGAGSSTTRRGFAGGVVGGTTTTPATRAATTPPPTANWIPPLKKFPPAQPDPIERPEYNSKPIAIKKNIVTATALVVMTSRDHSEIGMTADVIATVAPDSRRAGATPADPRFVTRQAKVGAEMQTSFDEAIRAVHVRYPLWEPGRLEYSFGEKYTPHDGGSAGTCFAVMMLSALEGFDIDTKCAITGDITVDWRVRKIGGTAAKIHGATADKCLYVGLPEDNAPEVADMYLLNGFETVRDIQVFSMSTLQDAVALLRKDRAPQLVEAMKEFNEIQTHAKTRANLSSPDVQKALEQVLTLAPNHLSAKCLLDIGKGTAPKQVTIRSGLESITSIMVPYYMVLSAEEGINRQTISPALTLSSRKQLTALGPVVPKELSRLMVDTRAIVESSESVAAKTANLLALKNNWDNYFKDLDALGMDKAFREKLMRE